MEMYKNKEITLFSISQINNTAMDAMSDTKTELAGKSLPAFPIFKIVYVWGVLKGHIFVFAVDDQYFDPFLLLKE